jgi:hypothetical protein
MVCSSCTRRAQEHPTTVLREVISEAGLCKSLSLLSEYILVDSRFEAMLVVRKGVEPEVEESFAVSVSDSRWEEVSKKAAGVVRVLAPQAEEPKGSQLVFLGCEVASEKLQEVRSVQCTSYSLPVVVQLTVKSRPATRHCA